MYHRWDPKNHTWIIEELLKPLVVQVEWYKDNKKVFESTTYAGYIGILTAVKKVMAKIACVLSYIIKFSLINKYHKSMLKLNLN